MIRQSLAFVVSLSFTLPLIAQRPSCGDIRELAAVAGSGSQAALSRNSVPDHSYRSRLVLAARSFELSATATNASQLLALIPNDSSQQSDVLTLGDSLCDGEPVPDMFSLGRIRDRFPRDLARAVLLVPNKLPEYVAYGLISVQDPHSDYAVQMISVCRAKHAKFLKAVEGLPADKREWFQRVFNPAACRALALPEAN
jgi:hypothetical protein